jgi:hypothetical protein
VQQLFGRDVFCSCRGLRYINMPRVFVRLQLAWWELNLPVQCRLLWKFRRPLHCMRRRKVEKRGRSWQLRRLPDKLGLT